MYNSTNHEFGYNIQKGGNDQTATSKRVYQYGLDGAFIREWDSMIEATNACLGAVKISECCNGKRKSSGGYMWSFIKTDKLESYKQKSKSKAVYRYSISGEFIDKFDTVVDASNVLGVSKGQINAVCNGKQKTADGYQWSYEYFESMSPITNPNKHQLKKYPKILQIDKNGTVIKKYSSVEEIMSSLFPNKKPSGIYNCLTHKTKTFQGYIWIYEDELCNFNIDNYIQYKNLMKKVNQYDLDMNYIQTFKSISDAAKIYNKSGNNSLISDCCLGKCKSAHGYIWQYA